MTEIKTLSAGDEFSFAKTKLWFIRRADSACELKISTQTDTEILTIPEGQQGLFLNLRSSITIRQGSLNYVEYNYLYLVKLQFFLDLINGTENLNPRQAHSCFMSMDQKFGCGTKKLTYWFINSAKQGSSEAFRDILRSTESYQLIRYLYHATNENADMKLYDLGDKYGLSSAQFRRLSRLALGNTTKSQLRDWRLARALLELTGNTKDITTIALDHGFSSLSHFSSETKNIIGISPGKIKKLLEIKVRENHES